MPKDDQQTASHSDDGLTLVQAARKTRKFLFPVGIKIHRSPQALAADRSRRRRKLVKFWFLLSV
jgi:hypothetical protein